jgi:protein tyrosine/serine phosphatase
VAALVAVGLVAAPLGGWPVYLRVSGNIHAVEPGEAYRAAQLSADDLKALIADKGIKTVLNLRGERPGTAWYEAEKAVAASAGARLVDIRLSDGRVPDDATLKRVVETLRGAEKPILIHCMAGADRTGLVAALYEATVRGAPPDEARRQLSFRYGHFPWIGKTGAMDRAFDRYVAAPMP